MKPPAGGMAAAALVTGILMTVPVLYVVYRAALGGVDVWQRLLNTRLPGLLANTVTLTVATTALAVFIGFTLAWIVVRTDVPGRRVWTWLAALPLAFPPYLGAFAYITVFGHRGLLEDLLRRWPGSPGMALNLPSIYSLGGTSLVLALFTYPYVYLIVAATVRSLNVSLEEAARSCGHPPFSVFRRVSLPLLRPAIGAAALLVALHVLSDFGAVTMLRYQTFTSAIYTQLVGRYDRAAAAVLSTVLIALTVTVLWGEGRLRGRGRYYQTTGTIRSVTPVPLGRARYPALLFVLGVVFLSVFLPFSLLAYWAVLGLSEGAMRGAFWRYLLNSVGAAGLAATVALVLALPVAYLGARSGGPAARLLRQMAHAGFAVPGVVVALSMVFLFNRFFPWLYGTVALVVVGYVVRFLPESLQAEEAALAQVSPNLEEAARSCGHSPWGVLRRVTLPLIVSGLVAGWALVFLSALKELPATLLLRPAGFDTLAVRVWIEASEGFYTRAAPAAVLLVLSAVVPLRILLERHRGTLPS